MARPTKRTPEVEAELVQAIKDGLPYSTACEVAGIAASTFFQWMNEFPEFSELIKKANSSTAQRMVKKITDNDAWQSAAWWLERRMPDEFGLPQVIEKVLRDLGFTPPPSPGTDSPG